MRPLLLLALLIVIALVVLPFPASGYREAQLELRAGNLLVQDQAYATAPLQRLFHSQTAARTDAEAFAFGRNTDGSISLAQTGASTVAATDTGLFDAVLNFLKFSCPTGEGYMHTSINDPIVSRTPVFAGLAFPDMTMIDKKVQSGRMPYTGTVPAMNSTVNPNATSPAALNETFSQSEGRVTSLNDSLNMAKYQWSAQAPTLRKAVSSDIGVPDTTNALTLPAATPTPTPVPAAFTATAAAANATNKTVTAIATPAPTPQPSTALPVARSLLVKPLDRQANKPFTAALDPDYNPRTVCRADVANISGWNRMTTNVIGRSGIDSTYRNRTSSPTYINPSNVVKLADQSKVISDSKNMTQADSYLQQRLWAL